MLQRVLAACGGDKAQARRVLAVTAGKWRYDKRWHLWSNREGVLANPVPDRPPADAERTADGAWATLWEKNPDGRLEAVSVWVLLGFRAPDRRKTEL